MIDELKAVQSLSLAGFGGCVFGAPVTGEETRENPGYTDPGRIAYAAERIGEFRAGKRPATGKYLFVETPWGFLRIKKGNIKVRLPVFSMESGKGCSSRHVCPFSLDNQQVRGLSEGEAFAIHSSNVGRRRHGNRPTSAHPDLTVCYAQHAEWRMKGVDVTDQYQQEVVEAMLDEAGKDELRLVAAEVAKGLAKAGKAMGEKFVRINDTGDVPGGHRLEAALEFLSYLSDELADLGLRAFLYTKHRPSVIEDLKVAGIVVVRSQKEFVVVSDRSEMPEGAVECPGTCGTGHCLRCPMGKTSYIVGH